MDTVSIPIFSLCIQQEQCTGDLLFFPLKHTADRTFPLKAAAQIRGRDYVIPADVREVFSWTVAHRLILSSKAEGLGKTAEEILKEIVERTPSPKLK